MPTHACLPARSRSKNNAADTSSPIYRQRLLFIRIIENWEETRGMASRAYTYLYTFLIRAIDKSIIIGGMKSFGEKLRAYPRNPVYRESLSPQSPLISLSRSRSRTASPRIPGKCPSSPNFAAET